MANKTEQRIIDQTILKIRSGNYNSISLRKIAKELNLTTGAFYKYFENKSALFYRVSIELSKEVVAGLKIDQTQLPFDQLLQIAQQFCRMFQTQPQMMNFLFFNPSLTNLYQTGNDNFAFFKLIQNLVHEVNPGQLKDQQFFNQIWSFIQGYALLISNQITQYDPQLVKITLKEFTRGDK
ncbi:TetR/AcrR family transcriptional regulator [Liquorilactobacillus ghanensis]|uniref:TetR/AcrR family transcriptional regulator n=1 Tax=Liquorilactobacillus ghanensis TaxID=399370 RepID=UPI0039E97113